MLHTGIGTSRNNSNFIYHIGKVFNLKNCFDFQNSHIKFKYSMGLCVKDIQFIY